MRPASPRQRFDPEPHIVNHVPDEVCVLVRADDGVDAAWLYAEVRTALNAALADEWRQPATAMAEPDDPLAEDLTPNVLRQRFAHETDVLRGLDRPGLSSAASVDQGVGQPWLHVPADGDAANWHLYFAVGADRVDFAQADERERRLASIRELVNLLNRPVAGLREPVGGKGWQVHGGAANWLTVSAQFACGSPASLPVPETRSGHWTFRFGEQLAAALAEPAQPGITTVVAILDTWPHELPGSTYDNAYLAQVLAAVQVHRAVESRAALPPQHFECPAGVQNYWNTVHPWWSDDDAAFPIADHGLFVAGIVHDIAPHAEIHVIRVLNEVGVGDALGLTRVLRELPDQLLRGDPNRRLIINMSLGATVPVPPRRHWGRWLPATRRAKESERFARPDPPVASLLDAAHSSLWRTIQWLHRQGVLVVAAAGNDALRPETHEETPPPPRYPARYQEVFAVAAAGVDGVPASYSNRADVPKFGNGITTFGGDVVVRSRRQVARPRAGRRDGRETAVVGVYASPTLPGGEPNETGWVRWAGTSFAAPVVAGVSARMWARNPTLGPLEVMQHVLQFTHKVAGGPPADPDPDGPLDAPVLDAWQEYVRG